MPTKTEQCRITVYLRENQQKLLRHAAIAYNMSASKAMRHLFQHLGKDLPNTHPFCLPPQHHNRPFILDVTPEELKALDDAAARLKRSRSNVLGSLLNHLTEFLPGEIVA